MGAHPDHADLSFSRHGYNPVRHILNFNPCLLLKPFAEVSNETSLA
jgi:predicted glycosyltransferase